MTKQSVFASVNYFDTLDLPLENNQGDWGDRLLDHGYRPKDVLRKVLIQGLVFNRDESDILMLSEADYQQTNLLNDFDLTIEVPAHHGSVRLVNRGGIVTVSDGDTCCPVQALELYVEFTNYLGEYDSNAPDATPLLKDIMTLRAFLADLDQPVHVKKKEEIQYNTPEPNPWLGLFNEAIHEILALRKQSGVDVVEVSGDAPWAVQAFFKLAQTEGREWFYREQETLGHVAMWFAYDEARRFCLEMIGKSAFSSQQQNVFVALYQVFSCSVNNILTDAREPFFKHVRSVYRNHKALIERTPAMRTLEVAYYDPHYLDVYAGVKNGTIEYMQVLENTARWDATTRPETAAETL